MTQELNDAENGKRVLAIGLQKPAENGDAGSALVTVVAPLGISLSPGIAITGDNGQSLKMPFDICLPVGCIARATFSAQEVRDLSRSTKVEVGLMAPDGKPITLNLMPEGLSDAWYRLLEL